MSSDEKTWWSLHLLPCSCSTQEPHTALHFHFHSPEHEFKFRASVRGIFKCLAGLYTPESLRTLLEEAIAAQEKKEAAEKEQSTRG